MRSRGHGRSDAYARVGVVFGMGFGELVVLVIVAIVVIGPKDLPKVLRKLGEWSGKLRRMAGDLRAQSGIDDVLRNEGLGKDIAEIRKLARGEIESVSRGMRIDDGPAPMVGDPYANTANGSLNSRYVSEDREHPMVGPDGFDAMPDSSFVYDASFPRSALDRDPLYRTGSVDGIVPDDPPDPPETTDATDATDAGHADAADEHASNAPVEGTALVVSGEALLDAEKSVANPPLNNEDPSGTSASDPKGPPTPASAGLESSGDAPQEAEKATP